MDWNRFHPYSVAGELVPLLRARTIEAVEAVLNKPKILRKKLPRCSSSCCRLRLVIHSGVHQ